MYWTFLLWTKSSIIIFVEVLKATEKKHLHMLKIKCTHKTRWRVCKAACREKNKPKTFLHIPVFFSHYLYLWLNHLRWLTCSSLFCVCSNAAFAAVLNGAQSFLCANHNRVSLATRVTGKVIWPSELIVCWVASPGSRVFIIQSNYFDKASLDYSIFVFDSQHQLIFNWFSLYWESNRIIS